MAKHKSVLIGLVRYSSELSYDELYELENLYIEGLTELLERFGAEHLDFWGMGDSLQFEGAFTEIPEPTMRALCDEACSLLRPGSTGRLALLDRNLCTLDLFHLEPGRWRNERFDIEETFYRRSFHGHGPRERA